MTEPSLADTTADLPEYPVARTCPYAVPEGYEALRAQGPVSRVKLYDGRPMWAVTGHTEARELLSDPRLSSSRKHANLTFPVPIPALAALDEARPTRDPLIATDQPQHTAQRRLFTPHFTIKKMAAMRPAIEDIVNKRIDVMLEKGGPLDLLQTFSLPIPSTVICSLLGVPYEDHEFFEEQARRRFDPVNGDAMIHLYDYMDRLVTIKEEGREPTPHGLLDDLLVTKVKDGELDHQGLVMFAQELLIGGHDTTALMITLSVYTLLRHPGQLDAIRADFGLLGNAIEELLRHLSIVTSLSRVATEDMEVDGKKIRAGDGILVSPIAANHDPAVFERPEEFEPGRPPHPHLAFGYGSHQCIGQNLARVEMEIALRLLLTRIPTLRLAVPVDEVPLRQGMLSGVHALPVTW